MERLNKLIAEQKRDVDLLNKSRETIEKLKTVITERNGRIQERRAIIEEARRAKLPTDDVGNAIDDEAQAI